ncbi:MAG: peptidylprolyl isomerase [Chitinispirillales bacterium]|jgi:parvulin-like peptidyl-prolyl isomerase|nr:peptidylprolyl isomerase [Chitinispirillales bacterium]
MRKLSFFLFFTFSVFAVDFIDDRIIAVIGDSAILKSDVDAYADMKLHQNGGGGDALLRNLIFEQTLDELIDSKILMARADIDTNLKVSDYDIADQVNMRINQILSQNRLTREQLTSILKEQENITYNEFKDQITIQTKQDFIRQKVMQHYIVERDLSREEVRVFFDKYKDSIPPIGECVRLQKIEINIKTDSLERQKAYDTISYIRKQIVDKGEKFENMAKKYSKAPNAENDGGDLGFIGKGTLSLIRLEAAAFSLEKGEISSPIETKIGWHLLKITERIGGDVHAYHIFIPVKAPEQKIQTALQKLDSVAVSNPTQEQFSQAVTEFGTDKIDKAYDGDIGWFLLSAVDNQVRDSFESIEKGAVAVRPFRKENSVYLYRISDYDKNRPMDFETDYDEISKFASQLQSQEKLIDLINRWRDNVFIKIYK